MDLVTKNKEIEIATEFTTTPRLVKTYVASFDSGVVM